MDGFALRGSDLPKEGESAFRVIGEVFAGSTSAPALGKGECVRIMTGAPMPDGTDTVVIRENVRVENDRAFVRAGERSGANVRAAGEDYACGTQMLPAGTRLRAPQLAVLAASGYATVAVRRTPRVAIIATGDELVDTERPLGFAQIHESNGMLLTAMMHEAHVEVVSCARVPDEPQALRTALLDASAQAEVIVSSGGVSAGDADYLPALLAELGEIHFHKVRLKPGMPVLFGGIGACLYFGLPGNPVSAAVTSQVFVRFALACMAGERRDRAAGHARLAEPVHKRHARAELVRCKLVSDSEGILWATPHPQQGSHMLRGLVESDALVLLPEEPRELERGAVVTVWPQG
jgi:molybdopterin molybdotransferase